MVRCSPTEFTEFTELGSVGMAGMPYPPTSVLICAICGSPFFAIGSVRSVRSVGISFLPRISQIYTDTYGALFSHRIHRIHRIGQRGYGRDAIPSYICAHLCHLWESFLCNRFCAFRAFCGNLFPPTDFTDLHRYLGCAVLPRNSQNPQNLSACVLQGCHTLLHLCSSVSSVGGSSLPEVLCIRCIPWELLHRLFGWCSRDSCTPWVGSVGMAGMPYPPTSVLICAICGSPFSVRGSVYSVYSVGASSPLVLLVQLRQLHPLAESTEVVCKSHHLTISPQQHPFTSNPAFCMFSQYCGYDFVTTCGSLMRSPGNTMAAGANAIAMRWSS